MNKRLTDEDLNRIHVQVLAGKWQYNEEELIALVEMAKNIKEPIVQKSNIKNKFWHIKLTNGDVYPFYFDYDGRENPINSIPEFDQGDFYSMDITELQSIYPEDPEENSFVLIPKKDIQDIFYVP